MKINIEKFVLPIFGDSHVGCGVLIDDYFITAAHVALIDKLPIYIYFEKKRFTLDKSNLIFHKYSEELSEETDCMDCAIFKIEGIKSPIKLSEKRPECGQTFYCYTFNEIVTKKNIPGIPEIFSNEDEIVPLATEVKVLKDVQGNFFAVETNDFLKTGNSGSPLVDGEGYIYGILRGGKPDTKICVFQYIDIIKDLL